MATPKAYCERNALTTTIKQLRDKGRLIVVNFPYDPTYGRRSKKFDLADPSLVTWDSTCLTFDTSVRFGETVGSELLPEIRKIIKDSGNKIEFDARHLDSAYRSGCNFFITRDKNDILSKRDQLDSLLSMKILDPEEDEDLLKKLVDDFSE